MTVRTLIKTVEHRIVFENKEDKFSDPEQIYPEKLHPHFLHSSRDGKLSVCLAHGEAIVFLPSLEPPRSRLERGHADSV